MLYNKGMDEDQLNDLKQFITATVSQATAGMAAKEDMANIATKEDIARLERKVDDGFAGVSEAVEQINEQCTEIDQRVTGLEQQAA